MESSSPQPCPSKRLKYENQQEDFDRLSNLSEPLHYHILSFMDTKHVVQTSVLATIWKSYWKLVPFLNFDRKCDKNTTDKKFRYFMDRVFACRSNSATQKFHANFHEFSDTIPIMRWIEGAIGRNLQELHLEFTRKDFDIFELPPALFNCDSLQVLELKFLLYWPSNVLMLPESINLPRLKTLKLSSMVFMEEINILFSSCPVLETLAIDFCTFPVDTNFYISALQLKSLVVENFVMSGHLSKFKIRIHAPSLTSFRCKDFMVNNYTLENFSSLVNADIDMAVDRAIDPEGFGVYLEKKGNHGQRVLNTFKGLNTVQALTLSSWSLQFLSDVLDELHNQASLFHNLRTLKVKTFCSSACYRSLTCLLKSLPNLETLVLHSEKDICSSLQDGEDSLGAQLSKKQHNEQWEMELLSQCMFHLLKFVEIQGFQGCNVEVEFLKLLLKNAIALEKLVITCDETLSSVGEKHLEELKSFPCASPAIVMCFSCDINCKEDLI